MAALPVPLPPLRPVPASRRRPAPTPGSPARTSSSATSPRRRAPARLAARRPERAVALPALPDRQAAPELARARVPGGGRRPPPHCARRARPGGLAARRRPRGAHCATPRTRRRSPPRWSTRCSGAGSGSTSSPGSRGARPRSGMRPLHRDGALRDRASRARSCVAAGASSAWTGRPRTFRSTCGRCSAPHGELTARNGAGLVAARMRTRLSVCLALAALVALPATAGAADVPPGADWSEATIPSSDGVMLHADILRPKGLPPGRRRR